MSSIKIRRIQECDNEVMARIIRNCLKENKADLPGTAFADKSLDALYDFYQDSNSRYFVATKGKNVVGGAGIAPLPNTIDVCELQKMYISKTMRRQGAAKMLIETCLSFAKNAPFKQCYIETMPQMLPAQNLYRQYGFDFIDQAMGATGHHACTVYMLKEL
ncbi:GNAT family N-acetyltransferase [uncultured Mesonia sp.]|uniref:GNAT family N-acetyltransferase n=1 Tax=uncultured Mesonia sp. TaxID=399731 RepID=UPI00374E9FE2